MSRPPNLPLDILDANLITRLLIVIKPLPFAQINARKLRARVSSHSFPLALSPSLAFHAHIKQVKHSHQL